MILMIDNYDSFTFNLVQYFQQLEVDILVERNDALSIRDIEKLDPQRIVISPGPCSPDEAGISLNVIEKFAGKIPILGVCLGHQAIAQVFGGNVVRAEKVMHGKTSSVFHNNDGVFKGLNNPLVATRYHSLVVKRNTLPDCFNITAWTENEQGEFEYIMGLRHKELPLEGVQFHPESVLTEQGHALLSNFLQS
ncbi:anthranilate synthase component II [Pleionea sediminis]|uniref:anthranilate synthase component II n=1 Tax=Pleionea sediminis TaxID=2569479 RepID=UPI00118669F6|nr:aminodeoxychorismate/anthranilate synthase component II [Pleionea sediminis]